MAKAGWCHGVVPKMLIPEMPDDIRQRDARNTGEAGLKEQGRDLRCTARPTNNSLGNTRNAPGRREDVGLQAADVELYQSGLSAVKTHSIGARNANSVHHTIGFRLVNPTPHLVHLGDRVRWLTEGTRHHYLQTEESDPPNDNGNSPLQPSR